jgi:Galactose-3-O-sulfotransferase/Helix-hairpin-helix motif
VPVHADRPILLFLHIPKTAGGTLNDLVYQNEMPRLGKSALARRSWSNEVLSYNADGIYHLDDGFHETITESLLAAVHRAIDPQLVRVVLGHFSFGLHTAFAQRSTYITLLRDPVERLVSLHDHILRFQDDRSGVLSEELSLEEFASRQAVANDQVRRLTGLDPTSSRPSVVVKTAKRNLERHFSLVGITERFDEAVLLVARMLDWELKDYIPLHVSRRRKGSDLGPETRDLIEQANVLDRELYEHAAELFDARVRDAGSGFARELAAFRRDHRRHIERYAPYPVDLNRASFQQLLFLPGVGPVIAQNILDRRAKRAFRSTEELTGVPAIGETRRRKLLDFVAV